MRSRNSMFWMNSSKNNVRSSFPISRKAKASAFWTWVGTQLAQHERGGDGALLDG